MFDFETNQSVKDLAAVVPEQFRPLYEEDKVAGVWKLKTGDPVIKGAVEAAVGLSRGIKAERAATAEAKLRIVDLAPLHEYGAEPAAIAAAIEAKIAELQAKKPDLEKVKVDLSKGFKAEIDKRDMEVKRLKSQLETVLVDNAIRQAVGDQSVDPDLVIPFVKNRVKIVEENGQLSPRVFDEQGTQREALQGPMTINDLVAEMKSGEKYARLFKSQAPRGSSAPSGASAGRPAPVAGGGRFDGMNALEKIKAGLAARR